MELFQRSVYDVLLHNLELSKRKVYIHRYIYGGEHKGETEIEEAFTNVVNKSNEGYCNEKLTGVLIIYPNYFIHIIDGDELTLEGHLIRLFLRYIGLVENVKLFAAYHHINQRFFDEWAIRKAKPPILSEKINPASDFEEFKRHLSICITKIYNLALELRQTNPETDAPITVGEILQYMNQYLPEYVLLNFLLNQNQLIDLKNILRKETLVCDTKVLFTAMWPVRSDYIPMNVFEKDLSQKVIPSLK